MEEKLKVVRRGDCSWGSRTKVGGLLLKDRRDISSIFKERTNGANIEAFEIMVKSKLGTSLKDSLS